MAGTAPAANSITGIQSSSRIAASRDDSSIASGSSGFGSLTKKKTDFHSAELDPASFISSNVTDSGISESSEPNNYSIDNLSSASTNNHHQSTGAQQTTLGQSSAATEGEPGHSRNSSNTSQVRYTPEDFVGDNHVI